MIHYHGTPLSSKVNAAKVLAKRHGLVSHKTPGYIDVVAEVCQSFVLDNGAFSHFTAGTPKTDWSDYYEWAGTWLKHPSCDWALIPDVIDGDAAANDALLDAWPHGRDRGVPVYHLHEDTARLKHLALWWPRVALGSSGDYWQVGNPIWWDRMDEVMRAVTDVKGYPLCKLHGLRMLNWRIFTRLPLASADSTNVGVNCGEVGKRHEVAPDAGATIICERIEGHQSAERFTPHREHRL